MEKINITLPKEILEKIDLLSEEYGLSRSETIRLMVIRYLENKENRLA